MPFCPACRSEFRPGFERCEECDVALVGELPPESRVSNPAYVPRVTVYQTTHHADALLMRSLLEGNGIPACIENENVSMWLLGMPTPAIPLGVTVPAADAADAKEIVKDAIQGHSPAGPTPKRANRMWLIGLALMVPALAGGMIYLGGPGSFAAAGAWAALAAGLILDLRDRRPAITFTEARLGLFFLLGAVVSVALVEVLHPQPDPDWQRHDMVQHMFGVVGPLEEGAKILPVLLVLGFMRSWRADPFTWVLAAASAGAGFGMTENLLKFGFLGRGAGDALLITSAGLGHAVWSGLIGLACMWSASQNHWMIGAIWGWVVASLLHGLWNALAIEDLAWINLIAFTALAFVYFRNIDSWLAGSGNPG